MPRLAFFLGFFLGLSAFALPAEEPFRFSLRDAILSALENNPSLKAQRYLPKMKDTVEKEEWGIYDPVASLGGTSSQLWGDPPFVSSDIAAVSAGIDLPLPTGTKFSGTARTGWESISSSVGIKPIVGAELSVTQSLLQGGLDVKANLAKVRAAGLDAFASRFELKGFTENLVYNAEKAYWDYYLALRELEIYRDSLSLAEQNFSSTKQRVDVGRLPELELAAARVDVAERREALIGAEGNVETARLKLLQTSGPKAGEIWDRAVEILDRPSAPVIDFDTASRRVESGKKNRPDLNQARLALEKGELEVVRTRNGLLPRLDLFISLGGTGYADTFSGAKEDLLNEKGRLTGKLTFSYPLGNSAAEARADRARLGRDQLGEAYSNLERLAEVDIRTAFGEARRSKSRIAATAETAFLQADKLKAETEKYLVGRSTSYAVGQAQRDLLSARLSEARAVVNHIVAVLNLYRQEGSLLENRGIEAISSSN